MAARGDQFSHPLGLEVIVWDDMFRMTIVQNEISQNDILV